MSTRIWTRPFGRRRLRNRTICLLGPVSYLDCAVFCLFLAPQLLWQVGFRDTVVCVLQALPFLLLKLPVAFIWGRYLCPRRLQSLFVQRSTPFEDFVTRCVRYAFCNIPPRIARVFFCKWVALPFLHFRMFRYGLVPSPITWNEVETDLFRGIWICKKPLKDPDIVIYYIHGGGFAMGTPFFYLEFFLTWCSILRSVGYRNPAILALDYTLVPDASYPTQIREALGGYEYILNLVDDPSIVCVSGDSAGAMLVLSFLLHLSDKQAGKDFGIRGLGKPAFAMLISPWVTLVSDQHKNTASDYLDARQLNQYGRQLAGGNISEVDPLISPGCCKDVAWWRRASPQRGIFIAYGLDEMLAPDIEALVRTLQNAKVKVGIQAEPGGIHAWPVASLFLCSDQQERLRGLRTMSEEVRRHIRKDES